ncbi:hypothetical protein J2Y49_002082 [Azospirillum sp. BE72]|nr:hypothetical protein [Azospirillum sp. BE72]
MTYINKVTKLLLQLGYWVRFGAVSDRSITETCASTDEKSGPVGKTATIARRGMAYVAAGTGLQGLGRPFTPRQPRRSNAARGVGR